MLFEDAFDFNKQLLPEHITMSSKCDARTFKDTVENVLEWRTNKKIGEKRLRPPENHKLICYVEDLHLSQVDNYGDQ